MKGKIHKQLFFMLLFSMGFALVACNQTTPNWVLDGGFIESPDIIFPVPYVVMLSPKAGHNDVSLNTSIILVSSIPMNVDSLESAIRLLDTEGNAISFVFEDVSSITYSITPTAELESLTEYTLTIATTAMSEDNMSLKEEYQARFTTGLGLDKTPPPPVQNITQERHEFNRATITWTPPEPVAEGDPDYEHYADLVGYLIIRSTDAVFMGVPDHIPYSADATLGNGKVVITKDILSTTFIDNDLLEGKQYQYAIFSVDEAYNYSDPVTIHSYSHSRGHLGQIHTMR
jgi:hypothetical protein